MDVPHLIGSILSENWRDLLSARARSFCSREIAIEGGYYGRYGGGEGGKGAGCFWCSRRRVFLVGARGSGKVLEVD